MKKFVSFIILFSLIFGATHSIYAQQNNPPTEEIKGVITEKALKYDIPPEILKAIAFEETGYKQYINGEPNISDDGGIGMMQVTPDNIDIVVDIEKLKYDIEYNVDIAAQVLNEKWNLSFLPTMNNGDRNVLENWYFAIMAYNGLSKVNDPNLNSGKTYQEGVYKRIEGASFIYWSTSYFEFPEFDIRYEDGDETMKFPGGSKYITMETPSQQMYKPGDMIYIDERDGSISLRNASNVKIGTLLPYTPLKIVGGPIESSSLGNDYSNYQVEGITAKGYASSAYLNKANEKHTFPDSLTDDRAAALYFLAKKGYVTGYENGKFGSEDKLKREHVAAILDRILDMKAPNNYQMKAKDVSTKNPYYDELRKAEYNGYLGVGGAIRPKEYLTRSQMASVLVRAFDDHYAEPTKNHIFKDQKSISNYESVNKLYYNKITISDPFKPLDDINRSQFALFIYRTLVNY